MALNASIFGNMLNAPKSPEEYLAERQSLQASKLANALNQQKADEYTKGVERQGQLRNLLAGGADSGALRLAGFLGEAADWDKNAALVAKDKAAAAKDTNDANLKTWQAYRDQSSMIRNPQEAVAWITRGYNDPIIGPFLQRFGSLEEGVSRIPQDPAGFEQWRMGVGSNVDKMADHAMKQQEFGLKQNQFGETVRHNKSAEGIQIRGQDIGAATAAASRRQADEHFKVTQAAGGKTGAATEDERKAAGWLSQADNAWKNMQAAMGGVDQKTGRFKNEDVARPGFADAITAIPSFGLGEVVGNTLRSPERQKFNQAASSLSEAILRAATGAGVNKDEALQKIRELTPVFGEDSATTKQKMDSIPMYLNALKQRAGRAIPQGQGGDFGGGWKIEKVN